MENNLIDEIWKDIPGYGGHYQISTLGNCRSISRVANRSTSKMRIRDRLLKNILNNSGYYYVTPRINGLKMTVRIHRLVAETFIPNPLNKKYVNHINGIKTDNRISNLEWCTSSENNYHAYRIGLRDRRLGRKVTTVKMVLDTQTGIFYESIKDASETTNIKYPALCYRVKTKRHRYIPI